MPINSALNPAWVSKQIQIHIINNYELSAKQFILSHLKEYSSVEDQNLGGEIKIKIYYLDVRYKLQYFIEEASS